MDNVVKRVGLLIIILGLISVSSIFVALMLRLGTAQTSFVSGNVAVIPIQGVISEGDDMWTDTVNPTSVRQWIDDAEQDDNVKAIVLEINSPGGSAVASDEIGQALKRTTKPTVAWIREVGASGGYWIASNSDYIIANRMSITGSVGVTASYIDFSGTLRRYNATYEELTGGEYKELGSPFSALTPEEREKLQGKVDLIHEYFLDEVQLNRNLSDKTMDQIRTGEFFIGAEAYDLGLVDELGSFPEVEQYLNDTLGEEPTFVRYEKPRSFLQELYGLKASFFPNTQSAVAIRT